MKNLNRLYSFLFVCVAMSLVLSSCKDEDRSYKAGDAFHFSDASLSIPESSPTPAVIPIVFTKTSAAAGSVTVSVSSADAVDGVDYVVLGGTTFDFAAGQYFDTLYIQPIDNSVQEADKTIDVVISSASAAAGFPGLNGGSSLDSMTVTLVDDDCPDIPTLAGSYTEVTNGGAGDGSGGIGTAIAPFTWPAPLTITEVSTNRYEINDITMGLYVGAYGASGVNPATFDYEPASRAITIDMAASPDIIYGGDSFFGSGNAVDACDGILTAINLSWANGYGDQGVSVLSPQ